MSVEDIEDELNIQEQELPESQLDSSFELDQTAAEVRPPKEIKTSLSLIRQRVKKMWGEFTGSRDELTKSLKTDLAAIEKEGVIDGVDFSYCQLDDLMGDISGGNKVEIEGGAHIYAEHTADLITGDIDTTTLSEVDQTGIQLAAMFRDKFREFKNVVNVFFADNIIRQQAVTHPTGLLNPTGEKVSGRVELSDQADANFRQSYEEVLRQAGAIQSKDKLDENYLMIFEGDKGEEVELLVEKLEAKGKAEGKEYIEHDPNSQKVWFVNEAAENPLYQKIELRSVTGNWQCVALDAATFIKEENLDTTHLVILPLHPSHIDSNAETSANQKKNFDSFKEQQHQVWEILRTLGIDSSRYHNIFYDENLSSEHVLKVITEQLDKYRFGTKEYKEAA